MDVQITFGLGPNGNVLKTCSWHVQRTSQKYHLETCSVPQKDVIWTCYERPIKEPFTKRGKFFSRELYDRTPDLDLDQPQGP